MESNINPDTGVPDLLDETTDKYELFFDEAMHGRHIRYPPDSVHQFTEVEKLLLINDNEALGLEPPAPTYAATNEAPSRNVRRQEAS